MIAIDFNDLPRPTRERFVRSVVSDSPSSAPICQRTVPAKRSVVWPTGFVVAAGVLVALVLPHFGARNAPVQARPFLAGYVAAAAFLGLSMAMTLRRRALAGALPYVPGVYVFQLDLVDARSRAIVLFPLSELTSTETVHHESAGRYTHSILWLVFGDESFTFEVRGRERAEEALLRIGEARRLLMRADSLGTRNELEALDPFAEARARHFEPAADHGLLARSAPMWTRFVWAIAIVSGCVLGVGSWRLRNWRSDERAFASLRSAPNEAETNVYLAAGGLHVEEAKRVLLPRARLDRAMSTAGPERAAALARFLDENPRSSVDAEARVALAEALRAEALGKKTVVELRAFTARWPNAPEIASVNARIRDLAFETLADFRRVGNTHDKNVGPVLDPLLVWVADHSAPVEVRFRRRTALAPSDLARVDALLGKGLLDDGGPARGGNAPSAPHFEGAKVERLEIAIVRSLAGALRDAFPAGPIALERGAPLVVDVPAPPTIEEVTPFAKAAPDVLAPTFFVNASIGWNGATYRSRTTDRRFLGLSVRLEVVVRVPTEPRALVFSLRTEPRDTVPIASGATASDDESIYGSIVESGFEAFGRQLVRVVFEPAIAQVRLASPPR